MDQKTLKSLAADMTVRDEDLIDNLRLLKREECLHNLWFFAREVLGYKELGAIHRPLCAIVESANPLIFALAAKKLPGDLKGIKFKYSQPDSRYTQFVQHDEWARQRVFLMFRGSFKTTLITIAHTIQLMLIYPDIRILIASHKKEEGSQEILGAIKQHFKSNETLRELFPEFCPVASRTGSIDWGTSERVVLPNRSSNVAWPEATIEIAGATTDVTGRHYDVIKADDLVTKDSVTNETMLQKTRQMFSLLKFLFVQPEWGLMDVVGTPYHFADLYATLRKTHKTTKVIIPVRFKDETPTFPERFSASGIEDIRRDPAMGSYEFSCQYDLNPVPTDEQIFRPEWWERPDFYYHSAGEPPKASYDKWTLLPRNLRKYVFVDPAAKRKKDSDYTALICVGVDERGDWWLLDIIRDKLSPSERVQLALSICQKHDLHRIHYEAIGFQDTDAFNLKNAAREAQWSLVVEEMKAGGSSKEDRIRGLQRMYEMGRVHWPVKYSYASKYERRTIDMVEIFRDEAWMFPKCEHDDLLDAHSQILQIIVSKAMPAQAAQTEDDFDWWRQQAIEAKTPIKPNHRYNKKPSGFFEYPYKKSFPQPPKK